MFKKHRLFLTPLFLFALFNFSVFSKPENLESQKPKPLIVQFRNESKEAEKEVKQILEKREKVGDSGETDSKVYVQESKENKSLDRGRGAGLPSCMETKSMMNKRISLLNDNLQKRKELINRITNILNSRISGLKSRGLDTSRVELTLLNFVSLSEKLFEERSSLINSLADLTNFDCEGNPGNFKNNLKELNSKFKNQNLEFNRLSRDLRVSVLYEIHNLSMSLNSVTNSNSLTE